MCGALTRAALPARAAAPAARRGGRGAPGARRRCARGASVELKMPDGSTHSVEVEEGQNVLDAALDAGIEMPHDCKMGVCMTYVRIMSRAGSWRQWVWAGRGHTGTYTTKARGCSAPLAACLQRHAPTHPQGKALLARLCSLASSCPARARADAALACCLQVPVAGIERLGGSERRYAGRYCHRGGLCAHVHRRAHHRLHHRGDGDGGGPQRPGGCDDGGRARQAELSRPGGWRVSFCWAAWCSQNHQRLFFLVLTSGVALWRGERIRLCSWRPASRA